VKIRRLTKEDEPFLWEMLYHALHVPIGSEPFPRDIVRDPAIARYLEGWGKTGDVGFAAIDEGQMVGAVWIRLFSKQNQGYGFVAEDCPELSIAVLPQYRNRGFGTELLEHMIAESARLYSSLSLSVSLENPAARLYERLGFLTVATHVSSLTMVRRLV
jgi:ribosomal protein S18 acetylase RimI-like enzyme